MAAARSKIVLVHRYYAPDTPPYATILATVAAELVKDGHEVTVLTCQPSYNRAVVSRAPSREVVDGVRVRRFPVLDDRRSTARKLANAVWFCARIALARRERQGASAIMAATTPPVVVALVCSLLARVQGASFVYHKQDIWPEVSGGGGVVRRVLRAVDHATDARASRVVVLSEDMAQATRERGTLSREPAAINNFDPWVLDDDVHHADAPDRARGLTIVFAGNIGAFQGLEVVFDVVRRTSDAPIGWHFFGDGTLREELAELSEEAEVVVHGHRPPEEVAEFVRDYADLGVVSLRPGVISAAYPSKTMTYLRHGCPILAFVEPGSELARMVVEERIGISASQRSADDAVAQLCALAADRAPLDGVRDRARTAYDERFSRDRQLGRWTALFAELVAER